MGPAMPSAAGAATEATRRDLQRLLAETVQRLRRACACRSVVAWALRTGGTPYVAAADFAGEPPVAPDAGSFGEIAALAGATDLEAPHTPSHWGELARRIRARAVAPVSAAGAPALAALLVDGDVSPRILAELDEAARQLGRPLASVLALGRLQRLDDEVRRIDRLAALGSMTAEIAHEARNPLVTLRTFVDLLPERREDPEFLTRYLEVVGGELRRMSRLLDMMVDHARPVSGDPSPADAGPVLDSLTPLLALRGSQRHVSVEIEGTPHGRRVALGEDALRQALLNVGLNAVDATPDGGAVRIQVSVDSRELHLAIRDEGPGIPPSLQERVFEPFFTTREGGGGLGLAITRRLVTEAGGRVEVASPEGSGTVLQLHLPLA